MDLNDVLAGFEQINPGFELRGDPAELRHYAAQAKEALEPTHIVNRTVSYLIAGRLRSWHSAEGVEEREKLHGEIRGLVALRQELESLLEANEAVQRELQRQRDEGSDFATL